MRIHGKRPVRLGAGTGVPCPYNDVALRAWVALKRSPYKGKQMQDQQRSHIRISNDPQLRD